MYKVKINDLKKVYPDFKPSNIDTIKLAQTTLSDDYGDTIIMIDGKSIWITKFELTLFNSDFGFMAVEDEILASYPCHNIYLSDYSFSLD